MNKILYITFLFMGLIAVSCKDEDRIRIPEAQTGANMRIVVDPAHATIRSTNVAEDFIAFDLYSENTDLAKVEVFVDYKDQRHLMATLDQSHFNDGVERLQFNGADLAAWFNVPGFADGTRGGNFYVRPRVTLNDGRVYPGFVHLSATDSISNLGTGITGNAGTGAFSIQKLTPILCPPVDISGTYTVVSATGTSTDGCCPDPVSLSGNTVTITSLSATTFRISDITGGVYFDFYDVYGITSPDDTPGTVSFNCNEINFSTPEPFGTNFVGEGLWDATTNTLTYSWVNGYADAGTVTLQRQ